jgi:histidyl-tRNA synthetase
MRIIDKIEKIGVENVKSELREIKISEENIDKIIAFIQINGTTDEKLQALENLKIENDTYTLGINELKEVIEYIRLFNVPEEYFTVDVSIARGLDYYTGTVYETFLNEYKSIGSICSGGRYSDLAGYYTDKKLPGVGMSIGLTRLFFVLNEMNLIQVEKKSISDILVLSMIPDLKPAIEIANQLRNAGINTEIYFDEKKIKTKFKYADKLRIPYVIVIGEDEIATGKLTLKNMETGEQESFEIGEIIKKISLNN